MAARPAGLVWAGASVTYVVLVLMTVSHLAGPRVAVMLGLL